MRIRPIALQRAFTLVELLVVIGIISLLISILLPALGKARKTANTVKCEANLHSIMLAFQIYASQSNGWLLGSPATTGFFDTYASGTTKTSPPPSNSYTPYAIDVHDWMTPVLETMGIKVPYSAAADAGRSNGQARWDRVNFALNFPGFTDPENSAICQVYNASTYFPGSNAPLTAPYMSYSLSYLPFLIDPTAAKGYSSSDFTQGLFTNSYDSPPVGYVPKFSKLGTGSTKICIADGSRYLSFASGGGFDMSFNYNGTQGGAYADYGAWSSFANGRRRARAPLNGTTSGPDERTLWARHGNGVAGGRPDTFRFNAAFFDGHVETLGDLQGADPSLWCPKGSSISFTDISPDVVARYNIPSGTAYIIPK